jgi:hypothetical protein
VPDFSRRPRDQFGAELRLASLSDSSPGASRRLATPRETADKTPRVRLCTLGSGPSAKQRRWLRSALFSPGPPRFISPHNRFKHLRWLRLALFSPDPPRFISPHNRFKHLRWLRSALFAYRGIRRMGSVTAHFWHFVALIWHFDRNHRGCSTAVAIPTNVFGGFVRRFFRCALRSASRRSTHNRATDPGQNRLSHYSLLSAIPTKLCRNSQIFPSP